MSRWVYDNTYNMQLLKGDTSWTNDQQTLLTASRRVVPAPGFAIDNEDNIIALHCSEHDKEAESHSKALALLETGIVVT
jgi:hypothetical protein